MNMVIKSIITVCKSALFLRSEKMNIFGVPAVSIDVSQYATSAYVNTIQATKVEISGDTLSGSLNMSNNKITNVSDPTSAQDVSTKNYVDSNRKQRLIKQGIQ